MKKRATDNAKPETQAPVKAAGERMSAAKKGAAKKSTAKKSTAKKSTAKHSAVEKADSRRGRQLQENLPPYVAVLVGLFPPLEVDDGIPAGVPMTHPDWPRGLRLLEESNLPSVLQTRWRGSRVGFLALNLPNSPSNEQLEMTVINRPPAYVTRFVSRCQRNAEGEPIYWCALLSPR